MAGLGYHICRITLGASILLIGAAGSAASAATPAPAWQLSTSSQPTNFAPGASGGISRYFIVATNVGGAATTGPIVIEDTVPAGLTPVSVSGDDQDSHSVSCAIAEQLVTCSSPGPVPSGGYMSVEVGVDVDPLPDGSIVTGRAVVGGGDAASVEASVPTIVSSTAAPFGLLPAGSGLGATLTEADGSPSSQAGAHPYQLTVDLGFPSQLSDDGTNLPLIPVGGGVHSLVAHLPPGLVVDPGATPFRCTEAELEVGGCPNAAAIGIVSVSTPVLGIPVLERSSLYNMVAPPGAAASFAFDAADLGAFVHLLGGVRGEDDFALSTSANDLLSRPENPILGVQIQLWGDPSSSGHDHVRGACLGFGGSCSVPSQTAAFLTNPGQCSAEPLVSSASADSWKALGAFQETSYELAGPDGAPVAMVGCGQLEFEPTTELRPTTSLADSPSGLEFELRQSQRSQLGTNSPAQVRDVVVKLPEGLALNPAGANGLAACRPGSNDDCPDAAKIGTVEVETPLLENPLAGSVYLAEPFDNPFGSLIAVYLVIDDPTTGIVAKVAGEVRADPRTGQLTARFEESPKLPLETVHLHVFDGPRALLVTPPACGAYTAVTDLTPWSSPEGQGVSRLNAFETTAAPDGDCPRAADLAPHSPAFDAGVTSLQAGAYAPFVLRIGRGDGSQRLAAIETTLPPGLTGRLAGAPRCSNVQLAVASCPAAAKVGSVDVGAGAGAAPLHIGGHAYLAGPYKGAPLSLAALVPAVAGPFDLGTMVVRVALHLDPRSAQIRAVSDPLPTILQGIPLDIRTLAVELDRPGFTLNPTSCDPMSILATVTSQAGRAATLASRFQVGDCARLRFEPRVSVRLSGPTRRGAHPQFRTVLTARRGDANISRLAVTLPATELLDSRRIGAVCTLPRFAARRCPPGSLHGHATVWTPLLEQPLTGPVYLRASKTRLPDLATSLHGQVDLDLVGGVEAVRGRLRIAFSGLPDLPLSRVVLTLQGARRGLFVNTGGLCARRRHLTAGFTAQNAKVRESHPRVRTACGTRVG